MDASKAKKEASGVKISFLHVNLIHCYYPNRYPGAPYPSFFVPVNSFFCWKGIRNVVSMYQPADTVKKNRRQFGDETIGLSPNSFRLFSPPVVVVRE